MKKKKKLAKQRSCNTPLGNSDFLLINVSAIWWQDHIAKDKVLKHCQDIWLIHLFWRFYQDIDLLFELKYYGEKRTQKDYFMTTDTHLYDYFWQLPKWLIFTEPLSRYYKF